MTEQWITWTRYRRGGGEVTMTRLKDDRRGQPTGFSSHRKATPEEIAEVKARDRERAAELAALSAFQSRPEYSHAVAIRNVLEWISPTDHPLDRLTLEEWAELRRKLEEK